MSTPLPKIGFVGVGRMGANMVRRLHDCGYSVTAVYDRDSSVSEALAEELGLTSVKTLAEVTAAADIIFTVVTNDRAMRTIFTSKRDKLLTKAAGKVFINCATVSPDIHREVRTLVRRVKANALEACMASSIPQARQGTLFLMIGGEEAIFEEVKPILEQMSKELIFVGPSGMAAEVKALVNMVMNINTAALAEGLGLGQALGLDLDMLCKVFSQTGANSRVLETDAGDMIHRDHECYFSGEHAAKDSGIALKLARQHKLKLPLAAATKAQYDVMVKLGIGQLDKSGVAELTFPGRYHSEKAKKRAHRKS